jgi:hypothetical protein
MSEFFKLGDSIARVGGVLLRNPRSRPPGILLFDGVEPPTDGVTGAGVAGPGSIFFQTNGQRWVNRGTKAAPVWSGNPPSSSASPSVSPSPSASVSASASPS